MYDQFRNKSEIRVQALPLLLLAALLFAFVVQMAGCGYSAPAMSANNGTSTSVSGTVNSVNLTQVINPAGGTQTATAVVLQVALGTNSVVLCGDQTAMFTLNQPATVNYTAGTYCNNLVSVTH